MYRNEREYSLYNVPALPGKASYRIRAPKLRPSLWNRICKVFA